MLSVALQRTRKKFDVFVDSMKEKVPLPILLDVTRLIWRTWERRLPTGIDRTCLAYVTHYGPRAQAVVQRGGLTRVLTPAMSRRLFNILTAPDEKVRRQLARLIPWGIFSFGRSELAGRTYLNVGHTGLDKPGHSDWLRRSGVRPYYFVHDLIPRTHPEYCRPGEPEKHLRRMIALLSYGVGVIGNSRSTLNELAIFAGLQKTLEMPTALVAPLGVSPSDQVETVATRSRLPVRPYFVMLGTIEGRKNHLLILTLWAEMARRLGERCPQLIIIGQRGWECEQAVDMLERCEAIQGHVIELARCDDCQLTAYLSNARALLFPTFVEGYGLPLVEALACGTPVIASELSIFRELSDDIPDYLSPIDGLGWMRAIEDYAQPDSPRRAAQISRMVGWTPPTWDAHFALVDAFLDEIVTRPLPSSKPNG